MSQSSAAATAAAPGPQQLPETWDAVAPTYAEDIGQWSVYADEALRTVPVKAADHILDVACGPGTLAFTAARRVAKVSPPSTTSTCSFDPVRRSPS
jgi:ubiquinone/menaquinone biosynthesis C-methylase UbiE